MIQNSFQIARAKFTDCWERLSELDWGWRHPGAAAGATGHAPAAFCCNWSATSRNSQLHPANPTWVTVMGRCCAWMINNADNCIQLHHYDLSSQRSKNYCNLQLYKDLPGVLCPEQGEEPSGDGPGGPSPAWRRPWWCLSRLQYHASNS